MWLRGSGPCSRSIGRVHCTPICDCSIHVFVVVFLLSKVCNSSVETSGHGDSVASVPGSSSLNEWRELRHEQDMAFQESLRVDELKEQRKQVTASLSSA